MKTSFKIFEVWGIPIKLHISFLLILPIFAFVFATTEYFFAYLLNESSLLAYGLGTLLAISFFLCILLHELGHSYVALKSGINISSITLMIFGGVSSMDDPKEDPETELKLALAGPAVSIVIGLVLISLTYVFDFGIPFFGNVESIPAIMVGWLGYINFVLAGFNLIPAFPMDGGRVLRSLLARRMPYIDATEKAAGVGKAFALGLGLLGLLTFSAGGFWFILIASFIYIGANEEEKATKISGALAGVKVRDLMTEDVVFVEENISLEELVDLIKKRKHMGYPVVRDNELIGIVTFDDVSSISEEERKNKKVGDVMTRDVISVSPDRDAYDALKELSKNNIGRLPVVEADELVGILSRSDFTTALRLDQLWGR